MQSRPLLPFGIAFYLFLGVILVSAPTFAGVLKVDINRDNANTNTQITQTATGYTRWNTNSTGGSSSTGTAAITRSFPIAATGETVAVSFAMTTASQSAGGTGLTFTYYAVGVTNDGQKLVSDGITVAPSVTNAGGQIQMTITGLAAGTHSLLTFHNAGDAASALVSMAPVKVYLNGSYVSTFTPSIRSTDLLAPTTYLTFTTASASDVTSILFAADTTSTAATKNVVINGFEIDTPNSSRIANTPSPVNGDEHVDADIGSVTLSWGSALAGGIASHDVYLGTNLASVNAATRSSTTYLGNQTNNSRSVSIADPFATYYWRVDEIDTLGNVTTGTTWSFRPRHLAFPGAEGYGRFARGGRGGVVRHVANLNDSGPGSLRDAITGDYGPRTVVFDVSGLITLETDIIIDGTRPYITVAGQTAPGKGICIKKHQFAMSGARDEIVRFVRGLVGKESGLTQNATGMAGVDHCIMDHCTFGWGIDEGLSTRTAKNLTFQRCSLSEALNVAGHQNYPAGTAHGYAASIGGDKGSFHHNLLAHNEGRNWSMAGGLDASGYYAGRLDIFNNVVYNWGGRTTDGGAHEVNFVSNYYKIGPASTIFTALNPQYGGFPGTQQYYMAGNVMPGKFTETNQSVGLKIGTETGGVLPQNSTPPYSATVGTNFFPSFATIHTATNGYKQVLSDVGCNQPQIDNHDTRVITETLNGTYSVVGSVSGKKGLPDTTADLGGWEDYGNEVRSANWDSDGDGLPDWWESIKGLDTNSPAGSFADSNADPDGDGYTNLEDYLNWLAAPHFNCPAGSSIDIDLQALSTGYSLTSPSYSLTSPSGGTVSLVSGRYARFTPSGSGNALGKFTFTVTDSSGDTMTRTVNVRVGQSQTIAAFAAIPGQTFSNGATVTITPPAASSSLPVAVTVKAGPATISGNTVTLTGAGTVVIAANQTGDANYLAAPEVTASFSVAQSQTIAAFAAIPGQTFSNGATVTITPPVASSSLPVAVTVKSGPATISGNTVTLIGAGTVVLAANQGGNPNYLAASEVTTSFSVEQGSQTIAFPVIPNQSYGNGPVALGASVSSGLAVAYSSPSTNISLLGNVVTILGTGTAIITASQSGDSNWNAATPVSRNLVIAPASQTIAAFTTIPGQTFSNGATVTVTPPAASSSLPVTLSVKSGPATISGNTVTLTGAGTVVLAANHVGNANYTAAPEVTTSFSVGPGSQSITFPAITNQTYGNSPVTLEATALSGLAVAYSSPSTNISLSSNMVTILGGGTATITASQSGDGNWSAATPVSRSLVIAPASQTIAPFATIPGQTFSNGATVTVTPPVASSSLPVTLSVKSGPATISGDTVTLTGAGTVVLAANHVGNANYTAAPEVTTSFSVGPGSQSITFPAIPNQTYGNGPVTLEATALSGLPVSYSSSSTNISINSDTLTILGAGTATITASQIGDSNWNAATPVSRSLVIAPAGQTIAAFTTIPSQTYSNGATVTVTPPVASSSLPVTLSVKSGPATISGNTVTLTGAGTVVLAADQAGNANYASAAQVTTVFSVGAGSQTISFPSIASQPITTNSILLSATASSGLPVSYSVLSGAASLVSSNALRVNGIGTVTVQASQNGDSNWSGATPSTQSFVVSKGSQTITFAPFTNNTYGQAPYMLTNATASSGLPVTYSSSSPKVAMIVSNNLTIMGAGTATITATQAGNTNWNAATSARAILVVSKAANTITNFGRVPDQIYRSNAIVPLPAPLPTASSGLPVTLSVKSGPALMSGSNAIRITGAGAVVLAANQSGNSNYLRATEATNGFVIEKASNAISPFTVIPDKTNGTSPFRITPPVASAPGAVIVSVKRGPATISGNTVTLTGAGTVVLAANHAGDGNYLSAPEVTTSFSVAKGNQTITFAALPAMTTGTTPFRLAATSSSLSLPVSYRSSSTNIALSGNVVTILGAGTATITASQGGDTNWNAATDVSRTLVVTAPASTTNAATNQIPGIGLISEIPTIPVRPMTFPLSRPAVTGSVVAWGNSSYLQNKVPAGLTNVVQISTRGLHNLALRNNGTVSAWGWNAYGQTKVPASATNAVQVAAGVSFSAVLGNNGSIIAWGDNSLGQTNVPDDLTNAVQIAAGSDHALALRSDGTVTGWGWNDYGQCAIPADATNVVQVAAGYFHSAVLKADGTVVAWGDDTYGETDVPVGLSNVVSIAAGLCHTVALKGDGTVVAWGWNNAGQTNVPTGLSGVSRIVSGGNTVFAVTTNGTLVTWGDNSYGQRKPPGGLGNVIQFVLGLYHGLGLKR